jgi:hypothetical protein
MRSRSIALLLSGPGLLLLSAARLLIISNYNATTAVTVASSGGFVNTLLGTVIPLVPVFLPWIALCLVLSKHFLLSVIAFVAAAVLSPASLTLPMTRQLLRLDAHHIGLYITSDRSLAVLCAILLAGVASWAYHRNWMEILGTLMALGVAAVALSMPVTVDASFTRQINSTRVREHHLLTRVGGVERIVKWARYFVRQTHISRLLGHGEMVLNVVVLAILVFIAVRIIAKWPNVFVTVAAAGVALVIFPYVWTLYPLPHRSDYYATALYQPWLTAEWINLAAGHSDYGYVLSTDDDWFTVLLAQKRTIIYIPASDVTGREVCQPALQDQPPPYALLVRVFYHAPERLPSCPLG